MQGWIVTEGPGEGQGGATAGAPSAVVVGPWAAYRRGVIDVAYLRVYRPADQVRLPVTAYGRDLPRLGAGVLTTESQVADAWEAEWDGKLWRCPRTPRRRMLESVVAHYRATERFGVGMIASAVADSAQRELTRIRAGVTTPAPSMTAAWCPPLRWFIAFDPADAVEPMVLRTGLHLAIERIDQAADISREMGLPTVLVDELDDLSAWLTAFGDGMVELDYRDVGRLLDPIDRAMDDTVAEVNEAVAALAEGDVEAATTFYGKALGRWAGVHAIAYGS